ncbi:enoyl-CoA hydratase/isomerase family protein [Natrinema sp. 1APR25-10V2]|uniref:enoyl-CoA hydratase/isomerase family protein n=1 Tax=Natrinema sp. 1APR25-10V2 TaxID=2951081 RepID=UPI0028761161|nr:enoyl-CoA hydratase/isomerase family protein [Natrinema sp. 1APR25-10V2]MDS0477022.1 enoyl-CoA hydratase/isomerase family protein [Natrinema sp. 1APR25-10V2]
MSEHNIRVEESDGRATVTIDRPEKANSLTGAMFVEIGDAVAELADAGVDVVTIRGADGTFSAGVDMSDVPEWGSENPLAVRDQLESVHDALRTIEELDAPVVAALEGHVLGGGLELALACDIRIADDSARFGLPESEMGLAMDLGGAQKLPGFVGEGLTKYLVMTGRSIDAERAYDAGLIEELHDASSFDAELRALEDDLAGKPTYVHGLAKRQVHSARPPNIEESMQQAIHHAIAAYQEEETQRRVTDFLED